MIASLQAKNHSRRGVMLVYVVFLIPIAMFLLMEAMTRIEIDVQETHREECRIQARLLAESALALWPSRSASGASAKTREEIPGVGVMTLEVTGQGTAAHGVTARGSVIDRQNEYLYEIKAQAPSDAASLILLGAAASLHPAANPASATQAP